MSPQQIREKYTTEMALAVLILRVYLQRSGREELSLFIAESKVDWQVFGQIAKAHKIMPVIYKVLSAHTREIPNDFLEKMRGYCLKTAAANMRNFEELVRLHQLLKKNGIRNIPYKGVLLSYLLFGDLIARETSDIDFLIDKKDFREAHRLLENDAYKPRFYNQDFEKQFLSTSHELLYRRKTETGAFKIELHWAATSVMMDVQLPDKYLFEHTENLQLSGASIDVFDPESHFVMLLVHHGVNDVWRSLRHCLDVTLYVEQYRDKINWAKFKNLLVNTRLLHTTTVGFDISRHLFGVEPPPGFEAGQPTPDSLFENILQFPPLEKGKLNFSNLKQQLFLRDSFKSRVSLLVAYARAGITPNIRDMEAYAIPKWLYPLYYILKPFRIISRRG